VQLLEPGRIVVRAHECEIEPLPLERVLRDALDVLDRDLVEAGKEVVRLLDLTFEHLVPEAVLNRPLRALEPEHETPLRIAARFLELVRRKRLGGDLADVGKDLLHLGTCPDHLFESIGPRL